MSNILHDVSDVPKISPFGVVGGRGGSERFVAFGVGRGDIFVILSFFTVFRGGSNLEMMFGEDIRDLFLSVEVFGSSIEELFEHIKEIVVLFDIDSRIFDD